MNITESICRKMLLCRQHLFDPGHVNVAPHLPHVCLCHPMMKPHQIMKPNIKLAPNLALGLEPSSSLMIAPLRVVVRSKACRLVVHGNTSHSANCDTLFADFTLLTAVQIMTATTGLATPTRTRTAAPMRTRTTSSRVQSALVGKAPPMQRLHLATVHQLPPQLRSLWPAQSINPRSYLLAVLRLRVPSQGRSCYFIQYHMLTSQWLHPQMLNHPIIACNCRAKL